MGFGTSFIIHLTMIDSSLNAYHLQWIEYLGQEGHKKHLQEI